MTLSIMIDYDNTYTADVEMWKNVIPLMKLWGHNLYLVTSRDMDTPVEMAQDFVDWGIPIIYCAYRAKKEVCQEQGIDINIWIDDDPHYITNGFITDDVPITLLKEIEKDYR